jgi:glycosyltransferase involved in cell wall biosynthesis
VLFGSYLEYFSPFWVRSLLKVKKKGIVFGSIVHDPIRDTKLGPTWWHQYSIRKAYQFLDMLFMHQVVNDKNSGIPYNIPQYVVPHGPYSVKSSLIDYHEARGLLRIPSENFMLLSFGHIRDNKNLHLTIECLKDYPEVHLVVAGQSLNETQKQPKDYKELAKSLGIENRISWFVDYIPDEEVATYFSAADGILLTYSSGFRSASGVLNLTSTFRKPCIASSGPSPLQELVQKYSLGVWVEPDDISALKTGMKTFLSSPPEPDWNGYQQDNSWERNAKITLAAFMNR